MRFKAAVFDLDGTLLDTIEDLTDCMNAALARMGYPGHSVEECKLLVGDGLESFVERALPEAVKDDPDANGRLADLLKQEYVRHGVVKTKPYDGIPELLDELIRRGLSLAVLSNKPHPSTDSVVKIFLSRWPFRVVVGARNGIARKPDPGSALEIARLLEAAPEEILYLGDSNTDMLTANAAGMFAVGVLWGFRSAEELKANGARVLIEKPADLLEYLD